VYARLLRERIETHGAQVWLVNTGWTGGPHGVGRRMPIPHPRAMLRAALGGGLAGVRMRTEPQFGLAVPAACPDVPADALDPRASWRDPLAYDRQARRLAGMFVENFATFGDEVPSAVRDAGPRVEA
jgi:phosphoenolpyruvate carboxykinase (ATP)